MPLAMLRISRLTDYATVVLATLAEHPERVQTATALAEHTRIAAPTVSKLLKQLQRSNLVTSTRGLHGGYQLARPAVDISAADILDALEGPVALTDCSAGHGHCGIESNCRTGRVWQRLNSAIRRSLSEVSLAQLAGIDSAQVRLSTLEREVKLPIPRSPVRS
jgi:FeS assembly SUF system regulator